MEEDSEICIFYWQVDNPFLPDEEREAIFCFRSPILMKWKATLKLEKERRTLSEWPVSFSLQYLQPDAGDGNVVALAADVSVNFAGIRNDIPRPASVDFDNSNSYTYTCNLSVRPHHGKLEIVVSIIILDQDGKVLYPKIELDPLMVLSENLKLLLSDDLYYDMCLQSTDRGTGFRVHSYILDARWSLFFEELKKKEVEPNAANPPTECIPISHDVLKDILTYLYTGSTEHFHSVNGDVKKYNKYHTELMQIIDKYQLHYLYMLFKPEPNSQSWDTKANLSSTAVTFRLEKEDKFRCYIWTHSPLPGVSVTTSLSFVLVKGEDPSFSYTLRFTNAMKLDARVNLEYRRKIVELGRAMETVVYEAEHEVPSNGGEVQATNIRMQGNIAHLKEFMAGKDRIQGAYEVEHSFRFILYLSDGGKCIKVSRMHEYFHEELTSLRILSRQMSAMLKRDTQKKLRADVLGGYSYLHKGIFAVRIPNWRNVIKDPPKDGNIPDTVGCIVSKDVFEFVIEYLYTATCSPTRNLIDAISTFATDSGFSSLANDIYVLGFRRYMAERYASTY